MMRPVDPLQVQAHALVPEVLADADAACLAAFGRAAYPPGTVVATAPTGERGTVLGPWRAAPGVMLAVDYGAESYRCQWPGEVDQVRGAEPDPPRLYRSSGGGFFWHGGFEYLIWRHAKGVHAWDVARKMPGGTRIDERCYVLRRVAGRPADAWMAALCALDEARRVVPGPYTAEGATG
ncbi:hypothetical protein ACFV42_23035 [Streptomyces solisilvae]|uniref:hypothetical protein n=1 Tax=Streptomyces malaysiensis TaxID=92644 RepID=UPI003693F1E8